MSTLDVVVRYLGDATQAIQSAKEVENANSRLSSTLIKTGAALTAGVTLPIVAMGVAAFREFEQAEKVAAQTNAVIHSTGQIANVTAKEVDALGTAMLKKTGIDDEAIKSGENMLLTFTNIRNEAGKNNDIFTQATKITADLSVAFGKDMTSSAVLVGKALQDPILGMTALRRVGVQLSEQQQISIRDFMAVGDIASAQKVILGELTTQVGGAAAAYGQTMAGQMAIAKEEMLNAGAAIIVSLAPALRILADVATAVASAIQALPPGLQKVVGVFVLLAAAAGPAMTAIGGIMKIAPHIASGFETARIAVMLFTDSMKAMSATSLIGIGVLALAVAALTAFIIWQATSKNTVEKSTEAGKKWAEQQVENAQAGRDTAASLVALKEAHAPVIAALDQQEAHLAKLQNAMGSDREAQAQLNMTMAQAKVAYNETAIEVGNLQGRHEVLKKAIEEARRQKELDKIATQAMKQSNEELALSAEGVANATESQRASVDALANSYLAAAGGTIGYEAAQIRAEQAQIALDKVLKESPGDLLAVRDASNNVEAANLAVASSAYKLQTDQAKLNTELEDNGVGALVAFRDSLILTAQQHGDTSAATQGTIDKVNAMIEAHSRVVPLVVTKAMFDDWEARQKINGYQAELDKLSDTVRTEAIIAIQGIYSGVTGTGGMAGGIVRKPTTMRMGERNRAEAIIPLRSSKGRRTLAKAGMGGAAPTFNINIKVDPGVAPAQVGAAVVDQIRAYERLNGKSWRES